MNTLVKTFRPVPGLLDNFLNDVDLFADNRFASTLPAVNIKEDGNAFTIELAAPGLKKEDFKINLDEKLLTISTSQKEESEEKNDTYTRKEFSYSSFSRSFRLPKTVDIDKVEATHENGILYLSLPKKEEAKPKEPRLIAIS
jgi:HSP20 family protein